jgi:glycosyltransferase involved in cell wall biosynthesis
MKGKSILYFGNDLVSKTNYYGTMQLLFDSLKKEGYQIKKSSNKKNQIVRLFDMIWFLLKNLKSADIILIDTFSTSAFYFALVISQFCRLFQIPYVPILRGGNLPKRLITSSFFSKLIFIHSKVNIAPSKYLSEAFFKFGYNSVVIPNIIEIEKYSFNKLEYKIPKLIYVRAFAEIYNPNMAVYVLREIQKEYPRATLTFVGPDRDGSQKSVEKLIKELKLNDSINITGVLSKQDWHNLSAKHNIFVNTTNVDNTPVSVIEAMALGLPVVSTNVGGLPFLIENGTDGVLVEPEDIQTMTNACLNVFENEEFRDYLRINARAKVEQFSWEQIKVKWIDVLNISNT